MRQSSALLLLALTACSSTDEHAPFRPGCVENCVPSPPPTSTGTPQPDGGAGGGSSLEGGLGTLTANVWVLGDSSFTSRSPYSGSGSLAVQGPTFAISSDFTATPATVANVEASSLLWVAVTPAVGTQDMVRTLQPVEGRAPTVDVDIARVSIMNDVLNGVTQTVPPPTLNDGRAQLVITFVDPTGVPLTDIEIAQHNGDAVVYDSGGAGYGDLIPRTGPRGIGVVINARPRPSMSGSDFPGGTLVLTYRGLAPTTVGSFEVFAAAGSVTFASVRIEP
jgi:hypothetical protein